MVNKQFVDFWTAYFCQVTADEQERRRIRRERNKVAASKCRKKRKEHVKTLVEVIIQFAVLTLTSEQRNPQILAWERFAGHIAMKKLIVCGHVLPRSRFSGVHAFVMLPCSLSLVSTLREPLPFHIGRKRRKINAIASASEYELLTKLVRSIWLDIGQKRTRPISSHIDRASLVNNGFIYSFRGEFSCGTQQVVPSGQGSDILPARVADHGAEFGWSCPLTELVISQVVLLGGPLLVLVVRHLIQYRLYQELSQTNCHRIEQTIYFHVGIRRAGTSKQRPSRSDQQAAGRNKATGIHVGFPQLCQIFPRTTGW